MRVLIVGCGYVGSALGLELAAAGHEVVGLRRDPSALPSPIEGHRADLATGEGLAALAPADVVVFATAPPSRDVDGYRLAYVDGPRRVLDALPDVPERVLLTSSTSVFGESDGGEVDEGTDPRPAAETARVILEGERALAERHPRSTVVRFGGIYGPGRERLLRGVESGSLGLSPEPSPFTNRIHRDDCAGALAHLTALPDPPPVLVAVDSDPAPWNDVVRWLAHRLGVACTESENQREGRGKRCRNAALLATGYRLRYPTFREGYAALIDRSS